VDVHFEPAFDIALQETDISFTGFNSPGLPQCAARDRRGDPGNRRPTTPHVFLSRHSATLAVPPRHVQQTAWARTCGDPGRVVQPATCATVTATSPTPPVPKIAMLVPASGRSALSTVPAAVWIVQPDGATIASGTDRSTLVT